MPPCKTITAGRWRARARAVVMRFACALSVILAMPAWSMPTHYSVEPAPTWIAAVQPEAPTAEALQALGQSSYYLLIDRQIRMGAGGRDHYQRIVVKAVTEPGVASIANIEIQFDPSWQRMVLHSLSVVREGQSVDRLPTAKIDLLQRESELERRIFDGTLTASVFLDDVRVGDVVDYAYSLRGSNPVFAGHESDGLATRFSAAVGRSHLRLLVPLGSKLVVEPRQSTIKPIPGEVGGYRSHVLDQHLLAPLVIDKGTPAWRHPRPTLQWSDYGGWGGVAQWALPLYQVPAEPGSAVQAEIRRIASSAATEEARLLSALRFVQGEVRYLGVMVGSGSHRPNPPSLTLQRRFGDCKDKTLLLLTLLDGLGIQARAALVHTETGRGLADRVPAATTFNHVIVQALVGNEVVWLDPTRDRQNADLAHLDQPDFGLALLVDADTVDLTAMGNASATLTHREMTVRVDGSAGFDKPLPMSVVTIAHGDHATLLRGLVADAGRDEVQKRLLNYYATYYAGIEVAAPLKVIDDELINRYTVSQSYLLRDLAAWSAKDQRFSAVIGVRDLDELLIEPTVTRRELPLQRVHPMRLSVSTDVIFPAGWPKAAASEIEVRDPAFQFQRTISATPSGANVLDRFESLSNEIPAGDMPRYVANLGKARAALGFHLTWLAADGAPGSSVAGRINWLLLFVALVSAVGWIWLARRVWRYDPPAAHPAGDRALAGIGGWLLLPLLSLAWQGYRQVSTLLGGTNYWSVSSWAALTHPGAASYHPMWAPVLLYDLISVIAMLVACALVFLLLVKKRTSLPRLYMAFVLACLLHAGIRLILRGSLPGRILDSSALLEIARMLPAAVIWIWYFLASERVRATFTRRLGKEPAPSIDGSIPTMAAIPVSDPESGSNSD